LCQETPSRHFVLSYTMDFRGNGRGELYSFFFKTSIVRPLHCSHELTGLGLLLRTPSKQGSWQKVEDGKRRPVLEGNFSRTILEPG
jgi:hypothetical protein